MLILAQSPAYSEEAAAWQPLLDLMALRSGDERQFQYDVGKLTQAWYDAHPVSLRYEEGTLDGLSLQQVERVSELAGDCIAAANKFGFVTASRRALSDALKPIVAAYQAGTAGAQYDEAMREFLAFLPYIGQHDTGMGTAERLWNDRCGAFRTEYGGEPVSVPEPLPIDRALFDLLRTFPGERNEELKGKIEDVVLSVHSHASTSDSSDLSEEVSAAYSGNQYRMLQCTLMAAEIGFDAEANAAFGSFVDPFETAFTSRRDTFGDKESFLFLLESVWWIGGWLDQALSASQTITQWNAACEEFRDEFGGAKLAAGPSLVRDLSVFDFIVTLSEVSPRHILESILITTAKLQKLPPAVKLAVEGSFPPLGISPDDYAPIDLDNIPVCIVWAVHLDAREPAGAALKNLLRPFRDIYAGNADSMSHRAILEELLSTMEWGARLAQSKSVQEIANDWNLDCAAFRRRYGGASVPTAVRFAFEISGGDLHGDGKVVHVRGDIEEGFADELTLLLESTPGVSEVRLGSGGGAVLEAIKAGRELRRRGIPTNLYGDCVSACAFVHMGGVPAQFPWSVELAARRGEDAPEDLIDGLGQMASDSLVGTHRVARRVSETRIYEASLNDRIYDDLKVYLDEMGMGAFAFLDLMKSTPNSDIFVITPKLICWVGYDLPACDEVRREILDTALGRGEPVPPPILLCSVIGDQATAIRRMLDGGVQVRAFGALTTEEAISLEQALTERQVQVGC